MGLLLLLGLTPEALNLLIHLARVYSGFGLQTATPQELGRGGPREACGGGDPLMAIGAKAVAAGAAGSGELQEEQGP